MKRIFTTSIAILICLTMFVGCGGDNGDGGMMTPPANEWAGAYETGVKWGGAVGLWRNFRELTITPEGEVILGGDKIINPSFNGEQVAWSMADGNAGNASFTLMRASQSRYFWLSDVNGRLFQGWYQNPGEGRIDFRGIQ